MGTGQPGVCGLCVVLGLGIGSLAADEYSCVQSWRGGVSSAGGGRAGALSTAELLTQLPEQSCQPGDTVIVTLSLYDETRAAAHRAQAVLLCPSA